MGVWACSHRTGTIALTADGGFALVRVRPPTPVKSYGEREGGGAMVFWPQRVAWGRQPSPPVPVPPPASSSAPNVRPGFMRVFAGWGAGGEELTREVRRHGPHVCRPTPVRPGCPLLSPPQVSRGGRADEVRAGVELGDDEMQVLRSCARAASTQVSRPRWSLWGLVGAALGVLSSAGEAVRDQFAPFSTGPDSGAP